MNEALWVLTFPGDHRRVPDEAPRGALAGLARAVRAADGGRRPRGAVEDSLGSLTLLVRSDRRLLHRWLALQLEQ